MDLPFPVARQSSSSGVSQEPKSEYRRDLVDVEDAGDVLDTEWPWRLRQQIDERTIALPLLDD